MTSEEFGQIEALLRKILEELFHICEGVNGKPEEAEQPVSNGHKKTTLD